MNTPLLGLLMPHPPLLLPDIGQEERQLIEKTEHAMRRAAATLVEQKPDVVLLISPHGPLFEDVVTIMGGETLKGDLSEFESAETFTVQNDLKLAGKIILTAQHQNAPLFLLGEGSPLLAQEDLTEYGFKLGLDYGAMVPFYFLQKAGYKGKIVLLSPGLLSIESLYQCGQCIQTALHDANRRVVILASGDNSHALQKDAPAGFRAEGPAFDAFLQKAIQTNDRLALLTQDEPFLERAAEDTIRSLTLLLGIFDQVDLQGNVLSYEGPFGVGYTVATFQPQKATDSLLPKIQAHNCQRIKQIRDNESTYARLARTALEAYIRDEKIITPPTPLPPELDKPAGCFVSLKMHGVLRGCIGIVEPTQPHLAAEIIQNAIHAGTEDDRFFPVEEDELDKIVYSVDVLQPEERVTDISQLDPKRYGLIVIKGDQSALLLPDLEGVDTIEQQLQYTKEKAGIAPSDEEVEYYRFEVKRFY